ncbi:MAG: GGDEF domain-containing protein [Bdellovibrionales bacterium]|nr:GGDEF domain-containing protein [Bdellovibrionales bacterium]
MKIEKYRSSFLVGEWKSDNEEESAQEVIQGSGYQYVQYKSFDTLIKRSEKDPPHFICIHSENVGFNELKEKVLSLKKQLPETQLILFSKLENFKDILSKIGQEFYQVLHWPLDHALQLVKTLDHVAQNTFYIYENEQLLEKLNDQKNKKEFEGTSLQSDLQKNEEMDPFHLFAEYQRKLFQQLSYGSSIEVFMRELNRIFVKKKQGHAVFFKYIGPRKTLVSHFSANIEESMTHGLGLNFSEHDESFKKSDIRSIEKHPLFINMLKEVFSIEKFHLLKLDVLGEVHGILLLWDIDTDSENFKYIENAFLLLSRNCLSVELEKRLHSNQILDPVSQALNKHSFFQKTSEEVARARRTHLPLAFVLMTVDHFDKISQSADEEDISLLIKSLVRIVQKHSRVNDMIGRISQNEFALLLPHTAAKGGAIKAERIRRMIESADFSQVLPEHSQITLSLSVSEYPSFCRDADDLFSSADRTLFDFLKYGTNKVVLAEAPDGFIVDFVIPTPTY